MNRGKQSAALLVVKENGSYGGFNDKYIDLRIDDHAEPVRELQRIYELHQLYFNTTTEGDSIKIDDKLGKELREFLHTLGYLSSNDCDENIFNDAIQSYHLIENFDERIQPVGMIDIKVMDYMKKTATESM